MSLEVLGTFTYSVWESACLKIMLLLRFLSDFARSCFCRADLGSQLLASSFTYSAIGSLKLCSKCQVCHDNAV